MHQHTVHLCKHTRTRTHTQRKRGTERRTAYNPCHLWWCTFIQFKAIVITIYAYSMCLRCHKENARDQTSKSTMPISTMHNNNNNNRMDFGFCRLYVYPFLFVPNELCERSSVQQQSTAHNCAV